MAFERGLQLAPLTQLSRRPGLDELAYEGPCAIDSEDAVATEHGQVVHDRHVHEGIRCGGAITDEQEGLLCIAELMDDCVIVLEAQGQQGKLVARQADFEVPLAMRAKCGEVIGQIRNVGASFDRGEPSRFPVRCRPPHEHPCDLLLPGHPVGDSKNVLISGRADSRSAYW